MAKEKGFKDRIKELIRIDPEQIEDNPKNWRHHSPQQAAELKKVLAEIGIADVAIVYPVGNGKYRLIDGHLRRKTIRQKIPAIVLDVNEKEADKLLLSLDPIASMAQAIESRLDSLIESVDPDELLMAALQGIPFVSEGDAKSGEEAIQRIVDATNEEIMDGNIVELASEASTPTRGIETAPPSEGSGGVVTDVDPEVIKEMTTPDEYAGIVQYREQVQFPSSNRYGIPDLRPDMLCNVLPTRTWGGNGDNMVSGQVYLCTWANAAIPPEAAGSLLNFYCDDYKFEVVWNQHVQFLERLKTYKLAGVCSPDFSTYWKLPLAIKLFQNYRSRWVARYWQEAGIRIIPSLSRSGIPDLAAEDCAGMPKNPPIVSTQCRTMGQTKDDKEKSRMIWLASTNRQIQILEPENVIIYGGMNHRQWLEPALTPGPTYHYVESVLDARQRRLAAFRDKKKKQREARSDEKSEPQEGGDDEQNNE